MLESLRKLARTGMDAMTPERAEEIARSVVDQGQALLSRVGTEVRKRMRTAGIVTREELSELKKRVRQLERELARKESAAPTRAAKSAKAGGAKRTGAAAQKTTAKRGGSRPPRT